MNVEIILTDLQTYSEINNKYLKSGLFKGPISMYQRTLLLKNNSDKIYIWFSCEFNTWEIETLPRSQKIGGWLTDSNFESVLDLVDAETRTNLLFHLDLFR